MRARDSLDHSEQTLGSGTSACVCDGQLEKEGGERQNLHPNARTSAH